MRFRENRQPRNPGADLARERIEIRQRLYFVVEEFDAMIDSNLKGPYFLVQALLPLLRECRGNIINILDVHVEQPLPLRAWPRGD